MRGLSCLCGQLLLSQCRCRFGGDVELTRKQTIMQGASHCDFRYALKKNP